jgi:hypothetical protein
LNKKYLSVSFGGSFLCILVGIIRVTWAQMVQMTVGDVNVQQNALLAQ